MPLTKKNLSIDNETIACEYELKTKNVVILHGAGMASRVRYYAMAKQLLNKGIGVVLLDFSGHGDSTGNIKELSLKRRQIQASAAIDQILPKKSELYLAGFSMSGQTVCDLLPVYRDRIKAILLGCPGVYTTNVYDLPFGTEAFTESIRQFESWRQSDAFVKLRNFEGKTLLAIGSEDTVILAGVIAKLKESARHVSYHEYAGVDHGLAVWLSDHPEEMKQLINELTQEG
ncbi:MAG TPA: alpha/beta fold hydrolase [Candidatus Saccharimonadales bacterium]|nr:alpha/beta fold hydrolase [Candidatus Saccharimonadales bacterium]